MGRYKKIIRWVLAIFCLTYIVWFFTQNTDELATVSRLHPLSIIAITCLAVLSHVIYSYRFRIILRKCSGSAVPFWPWLKIVLLGRFLTAFAPQAGNIYRSVCLKKKYQVPYTRYASSFFSFAWMDTCLNILYTIAVVLAVKPDLRLTNFNALYLLIILTIAVAAIPVILVLIFQTIRFRNNRLAWLHAKLSEMLTVSVSSVKDPAYMLKIILTGIIAFANTLAVLYLCFLSIGIPASLPILALFYVLLKLSTQILITPGNLGIRELAYGILSDQMNIGMAQGILVSVIIRVIGTSVTIILGSFCGGLDLLRHRKDYSQPQD